MATPRGWATWAMQMHGAVVMGGHGKHLRRITPGESLAVERCVPKRGCRAQQWVNRSIVRHCEWFNALHHLVQCKHSPAVWCA
ncbi:hypothetical protein [Xylella fastidiosa]|uniref:hypothetical protein n=1 Tax=Xylella fastidiosa TaxID=2371 RepID=UPI001E41D88B|nr:hypothetical protein [Xylella fastidiosa]UIX81297.1 hypothetical protein LZ756_12885 [Xylella fastidiosa subsp. sandyi]